jgi:hypothetical protein
VVSHGRQLAATTEAQQWRLARLAAIVPAGTGATILIAGVVMFVVTGHLVAQAAEQ